MPACTSTVYIATLTARLSQPANISIYFGLAPDTFAFPPSETQRCPGIWQKQGTGSGQASDRLDVTRINQSASAVRSTQRQDTRLHGSTARRLLFKRPAQR